MTHFTLAIALVSVLTTASLAERPNIVLVMADDQGWGDTGYNGHPVVKTPNLDAMAKSGLVFNRFYAAAPVCSPTRGSVLTGRHPIRIKITNHGRYMRPQEVTIAEALRAAGYPQFPEDKFVGHAAWLDWPWKLHRKEKNNVRFELYHLVNDPMEAHNLAERPEHKARVERMRAELEEWQLSVTRSLNGEDYEQR